MIVYEVKSECLVGQYPIFDKLRDALEEVKLLLEEGEIGDNVVICSKEITKEEFEKLEEFQGY